MNAPAPRIEEVVTEGFRGMVDELVRLSGRPFEDVMTNQAGKVLEVALRMTPAAARAAIIKRVSKGSSYVEFASGHVISLWKKAGDVEMFLDRSTWNGKGKAPRTNKGFSFHDMTNRRWSDERWARFKSMESQLSQKRDPKKALAARGVAKQSWLQIADSLGVEIKAPAFVRKAVPTTGKVYQNGVARKFLDAAASYIELSNDNPLVVNKLDGWAILQRALRTRMRAFQIEMQKGVFNDLATRARRYPGIFAEPY
jgi:hypothetical protein